MPVKTYKYSKVAGILSTIPILCALIATYFIILDGEFEIGLIIPLLLLLGMAATFLFYITIPSFAGVTALTLDEQGLEFTPNNREMLWGEIEEISLKYGKVAYLELRLVNNWREVRLNLFLVAGKNSGIYQTVLIYFENALKAEGQLDYKQEED